MAFWKDERSVSGRFRTNKACGSFVIRTFTAAFFNHCHFVIVFLATWMLFKGINIIQKLYTISEIIFFSVVIPFFPIKEAE